MRPFFSHLGKVIDKHYFFGIHTARDLECFAKGSLIAHNVYNQDDQEASQYCYFNEFVREYFKVAIQKDWGEILDFYCDSNLSVLNEFRQLSDIFKNKLYNKNYKQESDYLSDFKTRFSACKNFAEIMKVIKEEHLSLHINDINLFDKFYLGILSYGDMDKGEAFFGELKDKSFVYLQDVDNPFSQFIASEFKINPIYSYHSMIQYISGNKDSIELFFQLYYDFYRE